MLLHAVEICDWPSAGRQTNRASHIEGYLPRLDAEVLREAAIKIGTFIEGWMAE